MIGKNKTKINIIRRNKTKINIIRRNNDGVCEKTNETMKSCKGDI